jgi:NAD(P)-dependent dehydrogenase (short-subunit alcohol dehydrogenase family)
MAARAGGEPVVVVTGGNRGIGFEICRQLAARGARVVLTARNAEAGAAAVKKLAAQKLEATLHRLDVTDDKSIAALHDFLQDTYGHVDVLINNAGIIAKGDAPALKVELAAVRETLETNALGPLHLAQTLVPLLKKGTSPRIVNMSSGMGALTDNDGGYAAYRMSKTAINAVTAILSAERRGSGQLGVPRLGQDRYGRSACHARRRRRRRYRGMARARRARKAYREVRARPQGYSVVRRCSAVPAPLPDIIKNAQAFAVHYCNRHGRRRLVSGWGRTSAGETHLSAVSRRRRTTRAVWRLFVVGRFRRAGSGRQDLGEVVAQMLRTRHVAEKPAPFSGRCVCSDDRRSSIGPPSA